MYGRNVITLCVIMVVRRPLGLAQSFYMVSGLHFYVLLLKIWIDQPILATLVTSAVLMLYNIFRLGKKAWNMSFALLIPPRNIQFGEVANT